MWWWAAAVFATVWLLLDVAGAPSPPLFAGLVAGAAAALRTPARVPFPQPVRDFGMAVVGVAAGARLDSEVLRTVAEQPLAVFGGVFGTLIVAMAVGQILRIQPEVSAPTAVFASIAGGASGVSVVADEFGADATAVMAVQYLRVVVVLISVPLVASLLGAGEGVRADSVVESRAGALGFTFVALAGGLVLTRLVRFSASAIIWPMACASALAVAGVFPSPTVPDAVFAAGNAIVGLSVGLGFARAQLRGFAKLLPLALLQSVLTVAACAVAGLAFASAVGVSRLDGYLATSPGGLPAVLAVALDSGDAVGLILTMQVVRVFVALLGAPLVAKALRRRHRATMARPG